jgi:hypothetical protein
MVRFFYKFFYLEWTINQMCHMGNEFAGFGDLNFVSFGYFEWIINEMCVVGFVKTLEDQWLC